MRTVRRSARPTDGFLTQIEGVGALIGNAQRTYQSAQVYGLILVAGLFSLVVDGVVSALEAYTFRHRTARHGEEIGGEGLTLESTPRFILTP